MKNLFRVGFFICLTLIMSVKSLSAGTGLALLQTEQGARPAGMAAAFVSIAEDPNAVLYNPANAVGFARFTASFSHVNYWENIRFESGYIATPLTSNLNMYSGIRFGVVGDIENRRFPTAQPDELFDAHDVSFKVGLASRSSDKIALGLALGWFMEKIEAWRGTSFNVDIGLLINATENLNVGASVTNVGADLTLTKPASQPTPPIQLPTTYRLGASYRYQSILGAVDGVLLDEQFHLHLGAEARLHELFSLRAGYMTNYDSKNFSAGASFTKRNITVDYAFIPFSNNLGTSHLFSVTFEL
jgi:hypothetical protein